MEHLNHNHPCNTTITSFALFYLTAAQWIPLQYGQHWTVFLFLSGVQQLSASSVLCALLFTLVSNSITTSNYHIDSYQIVVLFWATVIVSLPGSTSPLLTFDPLLPFPSSLLILHRTTNLATDRTTCASLCMNVSLMFCYTKKAFFLSY